MLTTHSVDMGTGFSPFSGFVVSTVSVRTTFGTSSDVPGIDLNCAGRCLRPGKEKNT